MSSGLKKALFGVIIPVAVIILASRYNRWLGTAALILFILVTLYIMRATLFAAIGTNNHRMGKTQEALKWFKRCYNTKNAGFRNKGSYAYLLLRNGDLDLSEKIFNQLYQENTDGSERPHINSLLALAKWKRGDLDGAVTMLEEAFQTYKTTAVYGSLGYMLLAQGDLEKAFAFNLEAYEYNSTDNIILDNLGQNYCLLGQYEKSKEIYDTLMAKSPTFPEAYYNYGVLLERTGEPELALEMLNNALQKRFTFLSTITKEDVEEKIRSLSAELKMVK